ncbi:DUF4275 family protein [Ornithinibacillus halotolerans]|uniref:ATP synthase F1 subunit delta n=1 Tax=Ornithinibacillus halotolerans TaxID=1274357 RepID=A0A916RKT3_9BACI|nr:DUF4275 family protein [Ornithinibacillus halotolerans]GGA60106.1 ATP synthase F1 subunit delta [Ornithinibacillus halotolerans]
MSLASKLRSKGIIVMEIENKGNDYRNQWLESFYEPMNEKTRNHRHYLWELIHSGFKDYIEGKEANKYFDRVNKQYCYIFFQDSNDVLKVEFASEMKAIDLLNEFGEYSDVYVVDKGFNWTYVIPHEKGIYGPYFYRKNKGR